MNAKDIRWKQRFENFERAFLQLKAAVEKVESLDDLAKEGLVQRFEYTYELAWKTLKDFLESKGEQEKYQRDILKKAFALELINDGEIWLEMLEKRNEMAHTYDHETFIEVVDLIINKYFPELEKLIHFFNSKKE